MALYVDVYKGTKKVTNLKYGSSQYNDLLKQGYKLTTASKRDVSSGSTSGSTSTKPTASSLASQLETAKQTLASLQGKMSPTASTTPPKSSYTGGSIVDYLSSLGMDTSQSSRQKLAQQYGISNYDFSAAKNTELLNKMRSGSPSSTTSNPSPTTGGNLRDVSIGLNNGTITNQTQATSTYNTPSQYKDSGSSYAGGPYNMSQYGLVRFDGVSPDGQMNSGIVWLVDPSNNTLRPFESERALRNFFDGDVDVNSITVMPASELQAGGTFNGAYQVLSSEYAIKRDGSARQLDYSNSQLSTRYGFPVNADLEQTMFSALKGVFNMLESAGISSSTISKIKKNDSQMAFYVSALAYGGYSVGDIYSDVKKRDLGIDDLTPISSSATKQEYVSTKEYQEASVNKKIAPPQSIGSLNGASLDLPVYQLPDEAFKTLIPLLDYDSKEFQDAMDSIETSYYDVLEQQLNASTEQEKAIADYNYQEWKGEVEKNLGIQLSNNALEAWNQVEQAYGQFSQRGIQGSGLQNEEVDSYLQRVRRDDQLMRNEATDKGEQEKMNYYLTAASSAEIKQLVDTDPDLAKRWGLIPSDKIKGSLSLSELKKKYPNAKEEDLAQYISILLDENGNYRSALYQKQLGTIGDLNPGSASLNTLTGIETAKDQFKYSEALRKSLLEEEDAYKQFTTPDVAFLRTDPSEDDFKAGTGTNKYETVDLTSILNKAKKNLFSGGTTGQATPTSPTSSKTGSSGTMPTSTQLSQMMSTLKTAQEQLNAINSRSTSKTGYTAPKITTPTTVSTPQTATGTKAPVYGPVQSQPSVQTQFSGTSSFGNTANSTPSYGGSTTGGTSSTSLWSKLKSFF